MSLNAADLSKPAPEAGINPAAALGHMKTVIDALDRFCDQPPLKGKSPDLMRRVIYARNTISVGCDLWQLDAQRRLLKSQPGFYIFSMTTEETLSFTRRIVPGLIFTAEELAILATEFPAFAGLAHLAGGVRTLAQDAKIYAEQNKESLRRGIESGAMIDVVDIPVKPLPRELV